MDNRMATIHIPEEILKQLGLDERGATIEFACRMYDAGKLSLHEACKLAGLSRTAFEDALLNRGLPIFKPTVEEFRQDLKTLESLGD